jgi:hypothetical protein
MIPLALVAGFLGAGKTTFLTSYAKRLAGRKIVFLVNEFAATDVDTPVLAGAACDVIGISGGSIFCRCKVTDFLRELGALAARFPDAEGVVVEASGMADPSAARSLLDEAGLDRAFRYTGTITLVDPGTLPKVLDTLPAAERQVAAADVVVVAKADLHDEAALVSTESLVRGINASARIVRSVHGDCDLDPLALGDPRWVDGEVLPCSQGMIAVELACHELVDTAALGAELVALGDGLLRAKGFVQDHAGWRYLDWSAGRLRINPCPAGPPGIALIVLPQVAERARALAGHFAA